MPESFFNKVAGLQLASFLKTEAQSQVFSCELCEISKNNLFKNSSGRLLLDQIKDLCRKANGKLCALERVTPYMGLGKKKLLINSFFAGQFNYCPLILMFHSRRNNKITHLHERCLRLTDSNKFLFYEELFERDGSVSIHNKNIQAIQLKYGQRP